MLSAYEDICRTSVLMQSYARGQMGAPTPLTMRQMPTARTDRPQVSIARDPEGQGHICLTRLMNDYQKVRPAAPVAPWLGGKKVVVSQFELSFFLYGPRFLGAGERASISPTIQSMSCRVSETPAAIAGVIFRLLWMRTKL